MYKYKFIKQGGIKECGITSMSMIIEHYGGFINHSRLIDLTNTNKDGTTAYDIVTSFRELGFNSYGIKYYLDDKLTIQLPAIAHTIINNTYNHFVVVYKINFEKQYLIVADPADRIKKMTFQEFNQIFTNNIIIAYPNSVIEKEEKIKCINYLKKYIVHKTFLLSLILIILVYILSIIYMLLLKNMISNKTTLFSIYIPFCLLLKYILNRIKNNVTLNLKINTSHFLMNDTFNDLLQLPYSYYRNHTTGEIVSRLNDIDNIKNIIDVLIAIISDLIIISITGIMLFIINRILFLVIIIIMILYVLNYLTKYKKIKVLLQNLKQSNSILSSFETEVITGMESIKGENLENTFKNRFYKKEKNYLNSLKKYQKIIDKTNNINSLISDLSLFLITFIGLILIKYKIISYSSLIMFYVLSNYFIEPVFSISNISLIVNEVEVSLNRLINLKYSVKKPKKLKTGNINISNLTFAYKDKTILNKICLDIKKKDKIALIGKSGSGKSTLLKLLKQYYNSTGIKIDGNDLANINFKDNITYISQDEYLFTETLYNNIVLDKDVSDADFDKIINICKLNNLVKNNGYNMLIEENGFNLSGGEIERIVLARALIHIKDYLFIDEGLSEVDVKLEREILNNILKEYKDKTIVFITHRMNNIDLFDKVIDLDSMNKKGG